MACKDFNPLHTLLFVDFKFLQQCSRNLFKARYLLKFYIFVLLIAKNFYMIRIYIIFLFYLLLGLSAQSQIERQVLISNRQNPPGMEWKQIETTHFKIVFPCEVEKDAQRVANTLERVYPRVTMTMKETKKLTIMMQTQSAETNGFATVDPRRIEYYNVPPQSLFSGSNDWYNLLSIHEFRHISQFARANTGFTKIMSILYGANAFGILTNISTPHWIFEGDAVVTETALTKSGRGRSPQFDIELRAITLAGKKPDFYKTYFGSYKDWYPLDMAYVYGFHHINYLRRHFGKEAGAELIKNANRTSFLPWSFARAERKVTGERPAYLHKKIIYELDSLWTKQIEGLKLSYAKTITPENDKSWTYHLFPQYMEDGNILVLRYGQDDVYQILSINPTDGSEKKLFMNRMINTDVPFSYAANKIVFAQTQLDSRWQVRNYSIIQVYDIKTGKTKQLTNKTRFFSPALSPDGKSIAAIEFSIKNECSLVLLDAETGIEQKRFPNIDNENIQTPRWSLDGKQLVFTRIHLTKGKAITILNVENGKTENIIPYSNENIGFPIMDNNYVYYNAPYNGIDNIYAIDLKTKKIAQVSCRKIGAYNPALSGDSKKILFNDVTGTGYMAAEMPVNPAQWIPLEKIEKYPLFLCDSIVAQEGSKTALDSVPETHYRPTTFNDIFSFPHIYSWSFLPIIGQEIKLSLTTRNYLGNIGATASLIHNNNENTNFTSGAISYGGFYPLIDIGIANGRRTASYMFRDQAHPAPKSSLFEDSSQVREYYHWNEKSAYLTLKLPLSLTKTLYSINLNLEADFAYTQIKFLKQTHVYANNNGTFMPLSYTASFSRSYQWLRDINPKWGQSLSLIYKHTPFGGDYTGNIFSVHSYLFFPGLFKHHSLYIELGYEKQNVDKYRYQSAFLFPRGYGATSEDSLAKISLNYAFPIFCPHVSLLHIAYIKRFEGNLFADYGTSKSYYYDPHLRRFYKSDNEYKSAGLELTAETYFFFLPVPFNFGVRCTFIEGGTKPVLEPILTLGL